MNSVLIVSPHFPPSTLAGVHRARHLAKHLPAAGWQPTIVCVDERFHAEPLDADLAALLPSGVETIKVAALPHRYTRLLGVGDISLRAGWHLRAALHRLLASRSFDAVLFTGSPFYSMLLAAGVKRLGVPVVLDFQDPWVSAHGSKQPRLSKAGLAHALAVALEPLAVRSADAITSVSQTQNEQMADRYPWLDRERMAAIPIGGDPDDFAFLRAGASRSGSSHLDGQFINLSYVGTYLPRAGALFRTLFKAAAALKQEQPSLAQRLRLNFVGTSNQPGSSGPGTLPALAGELGVEEMVRETPRRVPYLEALGVLANSDGLLLIGSDEPHYTASKIYPALMSGRPFLSLFHKNSSAHAILSAAGGGGTHAFTDEASLAALVPALANELRRLVTDRESFGRADPKVYAPYTALSVARQFAAVFEQAARFRQVQQVLPASPRVPSHQP